jgi:hypothetical protein
MNKRFFLGLGIHGHSVRECGGATDSPSPAGGSGLTG